MLRGLRHRVRREDGQALVEFALVLPLLVMLLFAIFDFGRAVQNWNSETSLANVGARYAAYGSLPNATADPTCGSNSPQTIAAYVQCEAQHVYGLPTTSTTWGFSGPVQVTLCTPGSATPTTQGNPIEVQVKGSYAFLPNGGLLGKGFGTATITASATMMLEAPLPSSFGTVTTCTST